MRPLLPGDYYLTRVCGWGGIVVAVLQWLIGDFSRYAHAGIYLGDNLVAESMPGGLQINHIGKYHGREFVYSQLDLTPSQRKGIVQLCYDLKGTPYSYLGYLYVGLIHFNHCPKWVRRKVSSSRALFCSQMVDYVHSRNGYKLFHHKDIYLDVLPGDLKRKLHG